MGDLEAVLLSWNLSPFVRVAIENAAWEMQARAQAMSLRALFGLPERPVSTGLAIGLYPTLAELHEALERHHLRNYSRLKIKIKRGQDIDLVKAVRQWCGDIPMFVDANADYLEGDIEVLRELDKYGLMMMEQPLPAR